MPPSGDYSLRGQFTAHVAKDYGHNLTIRLHYLCNGYMPRFPTSCPRGDLNPSQKLQSLCQRPYSESHLAMNTITM